jgi:hypothetical protein
MSAVNHRIDSLVLRFHPAGAFSVVGGFGAELPFPPILSEDLDRMLRPNRSVSATEVIGGATFVASPADSFWILRIER